MTTNVYIDGFNLYYGALRGTPWKWLDLDALVHILLPKDNVKRIRYFTARVSPRPHDPQQGLRQEVCLRALRMSPRISIHFGRFQVNTVTMPLAHPGRRKRMIEVIKTEEKGSDVNLGSYLLLDAFKRDCNNAVVISNDADLKEPIAIAMRELGMRVGIINPHRPQFRSLDLQSLNPTFFKQLRKSALKRAQFPTPMRDAAGKFFKPTRW
jgi:NYN domain